MSDPVTRRRFLGLAGGAAGGVVAGSLAWSALVGDHVDEAAGPGTAPPATEPVAPARTLVVVQLGGGNDGLNTLVPVTDGRYHDARPTLGVDEGEAVALDGRDDLGLHPALAPLAPLWTAGRMAAVQGVGLVGQSRSHFKAMDTWWSATPGSHATTGWLGRWLDATGDPDNPLRAVALGTGSPALVGERSLATVVLDPAEFRLRTPKGADAAEVTAAFRATAEPLATDPTLAAAQRSVPSALEAAELLARASGAAAPGTSVPPTADEPGARPRRGREATTLTDLLDVAAGIVELQLGTRVLLVGVSGFDTHAAQADTHAALLGDLATGVGTFFERLDAGGHGGDVLVLTTSEFGRRVAENGSGTDHGFGGTQLLFGDAVADRTVVGDVDLGQLVDGDVAVELDTRSLYANALDWLGGPTDEVLGDRFDRLGLLTA